MICCHCANALSCTAASITLQSTVEKVTLQIHANLTNQFNTPNSLSCEEQQLILVLRLELSQWHPMQLGARCAQGAVLGVTRASVVPPSHKLGLYTWCQCCQCLALCDRALLEPPVLSTAWCPLFVWCSALPCFLPDLPAAHACLQRGHLLHTPTQQCSEQQCVLQKLQAVLQAPVL